MLNKIKIVLLFALALSVASCVYEDNSDCSYGLNLTFYRFQNDQPTPLQGGDAEDLVVYVFDDRGVYLENYPVVSTELRNGNQMLLPLNPGKYCLVVWAGKLENYSVGTKKSGSSYLPPVKGVDTMDELRFFVSGASNVGSPEVEVNHPEILYYSLEEDVVVQSAGTTEQRVDLIMETKTVNVSVVEINDLPAGIFQPRTRADDLPLDIFCTATNGMYDFRNGVDPNSRSIKYLPQTAGIVDETLATSSRTLRLFMGGDMRIRIAAPGSTYIIVDQSAVDLLRSTGRYQTQDDLDREDTFDFVFKIVENLHVSVTVNGWVVSEVIPLL